MLNTTLFTLAFFANPPTAAEADVAAPPAKHASEPVRPAKTRHGEVEPGAVIVGEGKDEVLVVLPPDLDELAEIQRNWRGVGIGFSNGLFGQGFGQSLRVDVPFGRKVGQFFGLRVEGRLVHPPPQTGGPWDPVVTTGLMLTGRGPVWGGRFRVYGGGGAWLGIRPNPRVQGEDFGFSGGGFFGAEFMVNRRVSFTFEVGGQGPSHRGTSHDAGASVMGGMTVYLGNLGGKKRR